VREALPFIEFQGDRQGEFHFGYVHGRLDCRPGRREGRPAVKFTWEGNDEMDEASGRGWAVLHGDELRGRIAFHEVEIKVRSRVKGAGWGRLGGPLGWPGPWLRTRSGKEASRALRRAPAEG
jgi:hypothetical protein